MARQIQGGLITVLGGMSQAVEPSLLRDDQYAMGVNISSRGGLPKTRPVYVPLPASFAFGVFQGAKTYSLNNFERIVFAISGSIYSLNPETGDIISFGNLLSSTAKRCYFAQIYKYMVIQDGEAGNSWGEQNWPVILDEDTLFDQSSLADEDRFPKGSIMAYGQGRAFVLTQYTYDSIVGTWSIKLGNTGFVAGDIIKSSDPSSVLKFTETQYLNGGGRFVLPYEMGNIEAMVFQRNVMSGTGQGPLIVGAENGFSSYQVQEPRSTWLDTDLSQILFVGTGTLSDRSFFSINSDIWYRATDGTRSLRDTVAKAQGGGIANDPLSAEVRDILALDNLSTLGLVSAAYTNDRYLMTVNPENDYFKGLLSLDFLPITSLSGQATPIYDGIWTGLNFLQVLTAKKNNKKRIFCFHKDDLGDVKLFYINDDNTYDNEIDRPKCRLYTGYKSFSTETNNVSIFQAKRLLHIEVWCNDVEGDVDLTCYYRTDYHPFWNAMSSGSISSVTSGSNRRYRRIKLTVEDPGSDDLSGDLFEIGETFQFCIEWRGKMTLNKVRFVMQLEDGENPLILENIDYTYSELVANGNLVELDDYDYEVTI